MNINLKKIIEALLISTSEPLSIKDFVVLFSKYKNQITERVDSGNKDLNNFIGLESKDIIVKKKDIESALTSIMEDAEVNNRSYRLIEGSNGYYFATAPEYADFIRLLRSEPKPKKLTAATLETLSIIAYRQPVTRAEIESIRGVSVDSPIARLSELGLIEVTGRAELPGKPIQYGTGEKFLEFSGIRNLDDLPISDVLNNIQIDDFMRAEKESKSRISDESVGLAKEVAPSELPLDETFVDINWKKENIESDTQNKGTCNFENE